MSGVCTAWANLVFTGPGETQFTLIPNSPNSIACCWVNWIIAAFEVPYAILKVDALNPDIDAILIIFPLVFFKYLITFLCS